MPLSSIIYLQGENPASLSTGSGATQVLTQTNAADEGSSGRDVFNLRSGYSGEGYLDFGSSDTGDEAVTYDVNMPEAGTFDLHIRYASAGTRTAQLSYGAGQETVSFGPTGSTGAEAFDNWNVVTVPVVLALGQNTIQLALFGGNGPNVDALAISNPGETPDFAPRFTTKGAFTVAEGEVAVGSVGATDVDENTTDADDSVDPVTYSVVGTADGSAFAIDPDTGDLTLNAPADFETKDRYDLVVAATDAGGNTTEQAVAVTVADDPADNPAGSARLTVNAASNGLETASTFTNGTIVFANTGGKAITSVTIDLSDALFTNANSAMVFDPAGGAGDTVAKDFDNNGGTGDYTVTPALTGGNDADGYTTLTLTFAGGLQAGGTLEFSIDIDPDSIKGATGSGDAGSVSGLELTGSTVAVTFDDATMATSTLFADGSLAGAVATISDAEPAAPSLSLGGASGDVAVTSGGTQTVTVTGLANTTVTVLIAEGGLGNGVSARTPFDTNTATGVRYETVTLDGAGQGTFTVTVADGTPLYMAAAVQGDGAGEFGAVSASLAVAVAPGPEPTPAWSFISVPDMFNADYADISGGLDPDIAAVFDDGSADDDVDYTDGLIGAPDWQPGDDNSMNVALARVWKTNTEMMVAAAGGNPDLVAIAGDLIYARFTQHIAATEALFDKDGDANFAQTLNDAGAAYYSWMRKLWEEAGVDTVVAAIGDHEIGDNNWPSGPRTDFVPAMKEAFGEHMVDPLGIAPTWNGVTAFAPEGDGQYDEGSYVYQNKNVLFLTVDVFKFSATGGLAAGGVEASVDGAHLQWIEDILDAAETDASVDHVIVQGHVPVLTPVNSIRSSEMSFEGGENSSFWQALQGHGTNAGGKVRAYLNGEVHATTVIEDASSGIVQISHGATNQADGAAQLDPYFMTFEVTPTRITGREFTIVNDNNDTSDTVWEAHRMSSQTVDTVGAMTEIGTIEIDIGTGTTSVATTGNLQAPLRAEGHQTFVGGPGDDEHAGGIPGAGFTQDNVMYGRGGNDALDGRGGPDRIFGETGEDTLIAGTGTDTLTGGPDADTYVFEIGDGNDIITDFSRAEGDKIRIGVASFADLTITQDGSDALVVYAGGQVRLQGVEASTLVAADFGFQPTEALDPLYFDNISLNTGFAFPTELVREVTAGIEVFNDRDFTLAEFPAELEGGRLIVVNNDDKTLDEAASYLSFTAARDGFVYVAYHSTGDSLPGWLEGPQWVAVGEDVVLNRADGTSPPPWILYGRAVSAGETLVLGGNDGADNDATTDDTGALNGYFVIGDDTALFTPPALDTLDEQILVEAEDGTVVDVDTGGEFSATRALTQTNGEISGGADNDVFGLRPGYSGDGYIDFGEANDSLTLTIDSPEAGTFDLHIRYASFLSGGADRTADISLNGGPAVTTAFPGADDVAGEISFDTWKVLTTSVTLIEGPNTLSLTLTGSGPNVDAIAVTNPGGAPNFAPSFTTLPDFVLDENQTDIGTVGAADVDDDQTDGVDTSTAVTFARAGGADADAFAVDPTSGALSFAAAPDADAFADADGDNVYEVLIRATDAAGTAVTQAVTVTVNGIDDEPTTLSLTPLAVTENQPGAVLADIVATDPDTDLSTITAAQVGLDDTTNFRVIGTAGALQLALAEGVALDFEAAAQPSLTVTLNGTSDVFTPAPLNDSSDDDPMENETFETLIIQAEDGTPGETNSTGTAIRDADNPETGGFTGLRPDFGGTGYIDYGSAAGDSYTYTFTDAEGGARLLHVRYATNGDRPLDVLVNGASVVSDPVIATPFTDTDPDGTGGAEGFDTWEVATFEITTTAGENTVTLEIPAPGANAPNVDAVAISAVGEIVDFPAADISADADGNLGVTPAAYTVGLSEAGSVDFTLSGIDDDVTGLEVSTDGGTTFAPATLGAVNDGVAQVTADLSAVTDPGSSDIVFRVTDGAANTATTSVTLDFVAKAVVAEIQAETFAITDADGDTAQASNQPGFTGTGFMDLGNDVGDAVSFDVTVADTGTYTLLFRYASGSDRRMTLDVNASGSPLDVPFVSTGNFETWGAQAIEVELGEGPNTITLANAIVNGPNIDRVTILRDAPATDTPPTAQDGAGAGVEDDGPIVVDIVDLIADAEDDPSEPTITAATVDAASGTVSFAGTELTFTPAADFNGDAVIAYTVEDSAGQPASAEVTVTVAAVNDAPTLTGAVDDATVPLAGGTVDLSGLTAEDVDGDTLTLGVRSAGGADAPDGVAIDANGDLVIPSGLDAGDLALEVFADDGTVESAALPLTVTVEAAPDLAYEVPTDGDLVIQLENRDGSIVINDTDIPDTGGINNIDLTQFRDALNPELNGDGTAQEGGGKTGGLWDGKTGEGYLDMGGQVGDQAAFDVTVEAAGEYTFAFRYNNGSDFNNGRRPMDIAVGGVVQATPDFSSGASWTDWLTETVTLNLPAGTSTISMTNTVANGPNLDQVTITPPNAAPVADAASATTAEDTPLVIDVAGLVTDDRDSDADLIVTAEAANGTVSVSGTELTFTPDADYSGPATITYRAEDTDGAVSVDATIAVDVTPVEDEATAITLTERPVAENVAGAVVADVVVADPDTAYQAADLDLTDPSGLFELVDGENGIELKLKVGESLDFEAQPQPGVTVALGAVQSAPFVPTVTDVTESAEVTFDLSTITSYTSGQDRPGDGGAGASVGVDGTSLTLDGNLWKRVPLDGAYPITGDSQLQVTIEIGAEVPEIVAIGFDDNENPFENDRTVYQIAGTQTQNNFVDLRGEGIENSDGTITFTIDLFAQAGSSPASMIFISDDDSGALGSVTFSDVSLSEATGGSGGNTPPREIGLGVADFEVPEGGTLEVDMPFVDDDGDELSFSFEIADANGDPVVVDGLSISDGVLSGPAPDEPGVYTVTLRADDDGEGGHVPVQSVFTLTVSDVNDAPVVADPALEPYFYQAGAPIPGIELSVFETFFDDPDGDALTLTAEGLPAGLTVNAEGAIEGTPTVGGTFDVTIRAADPDGESATLTIQLQIAGGQIGEVTVIEAEDLNGLSGATGFYATGQAGASDDQIIRVASAGTAAAITSDLSANGLIEGWYQVAMTRYDETDGSAVYSLQIGETVLAEDAAFDGTPDAETATDTFDNAAGRGNAGQAGNLKTIVYEEPVFVGAGTILTLSGTSNGELLRTDKFTFTRVEEPNEAPGAVSLSANTVAENDADGAVIGTLSATDPDGDDAAISFAVPDASPFEVNGNVLGLKPGAALDFEDTPSVDVVITATDAQGASTETTLTIAVTDIDEPAGAPQLAAGTVLENDPGAVIGTLTAIDPEGGPVTFTVVGPSSPFQIVNGNELRLKDGESLDFEASPTVTVTVAADDGNGPVEGDVTFGVTDANDAPTLAVGAALSDLDVANGAGAIIDLTVLGAADEDAGDTPDYAIDSATPLPAGFEVVGTDLIVPADAPAGAYEIVVFATDGQADSDSVSFTVTVGDPAPFETIVIQGEALTPIPDGDTNDGNDNLIRTETQNQERDPEGVDLDGVQANPGLPEYDPVSGLRPDYIGTGYLDINGTDTGAQAETTFTAPAGTYEITFRLANGSTDPRPITIDVDGVQATIADTNTTQWYLWETRTVTVELATGGQHTLAILQDSTAGAPNIDAVAIAEPGTPVDFLPDETADEDGDLAAAPENATVAVADLQTVEIRLSGVDADIVGYEISVDGGATFEATEPVADGPDQIVTVDLTGAAAGTTVDVQVRLTDDAGNEVTTVTSVDVENEVVTVDPVTIQAEDETLVTVVDLGGAGQGEETREVNETAPDDFGNFRTGAVGEAYIDFGTNPGDAISVAFDAPVAGTYEVTLRYANGSAGNRPLDLTVNGGAPSQIAFAQTDAPSADLSGWEGWSDLSVRVDLQAGPNTLELAIPSTADGGVDNGPNIDQLTFTYVDPALDDSADEDGNLDLSVPASVAVGEADSVEFNLVGVDADIVAYEVSTDGGANFVPVTPVGDTVSLDLSAFGAGTTADVVFRLTDDAANTVERTASVAIVADPVEAFEVTLQLETRVSDVPGEDNSPANITIFDDTGDGDGDADSTQIRDPLNIEGATPERGPDGLWDNFNGTGYLDMGQNAGDAFSFEIDAPGAGTYTVAFRYGNGGAADRPMDLIVGGQSVRIAFSSTTDWDNWQIATAEVELEAGINTLRMEIPDDVSTFTGPNLDEVTVSREGDVVTPPDSEPGPRETIRINFQDGTAPKVDGYLVGNFDGFADQGNGQTYGWITEASALDADGTTNTPIVAGDYPEIAINERTAAGVDPRLLGYAHFDLGGYPERTAWEIALENGWYEVTVAVGDTAGPNNSDNRLFIEGDLATAWSSTDAFKSQLITTTANVQDGRLTLSAQGGSITEMQYLEIRELPDLTPGDGNAAPADYAELTGLVTLPNGEELAFGDGLRPEGIDPTANFAFDVSVAGNRGGVLETSLNNDTVKLFETLTGEEVSLALNTTGGFDAVVFNPDEDLKEFTSYTIVVDGLLDRGSNDDPNSAPREFRKYSTSFVTGEAPDVVDREVAFDDVVQVEEGGFASVVMSPDGSQIYVSTLYGAILRWDLDPVTGEVVVDSRQSLNLPELSGEAIIGLAFDPADAGRIWITANDGGLSNADDFTGEIYTLELGDGPDFTATSSLVVTGLPRSARDHLSNSLVFRENPDADQPDQPSHLLYLIQGSNSAMGAPDSAWDWRAERALSAAVIEIDPRVADNGAPLDVQTEEAWRATTTNSVAIDPLNDPSNPHAPGGSGTEYSFTPDGEAFVEGFYNPFAEDAQVRVFANGQRNAYDLVWHSNGLLYVPTNGSAGGANAPDDPSTPQDEGLIGIPTRNDYLFAVEEDGYYGHPNPILGNFILNGGNPTSGTDPAEVSTYDVGTDPDPNYRGFAFDFGRNISPNGAAEYTSDVFGANLQGAVIVVQYSSPDNLIALMPGPDGNIISSQVIQRPDNSIIQYGDPLDVIVNPETGQMYMVTFERNAAFDISSKLVLLNPAPGGVVEDNDADVGNDLALTVIDASDPAAVVFAVTGLDDDIVTVSVSFNNTASQVVALDGQNRFTFDLSDQTATVDATLTVDDDAGNSASSPTISFTPGETSEPQGFYDGVDFTNLDPASTIIRVANDPDTADSGGFDTDGDGLNDGADGNSYVDFGGGAGDKVSLDVTVTTAGLYDIVLRMANGNATQLRPIDVKLGDQVVSITDTNTGSFTAWEDFPIQLTLAAGVNTIVFEQVNAAGGPNIDSATVTLNTPTGVPNDGTETVGGIDFVIYEAENADLGGAIVDADPRNQRGGEFVDYDGTGDQTVTFTVSAPEDGTYQVDLLYALAGSKDARPMTVTINGTDAGELPFPPNSNEAESLWTPQTATLSLTAGINTIAFTAPAANGPNIDYLRVSTAPVDIFDPAYAAIDGSGRIELEAGDGTARPVDADTAEFYFTVAQDGAYVFDLAANPGAADGGGITVSLSADGALPVVIDDNGFPGAGETGEVSAFANLEAGVEYRLIVQSDAPGANDLDYLDVSPASGNENADIAVQSLDPAFFGDRLHFSWVENSDGRASKTSAQIEITNTGTETLDILDVEISEFYSVVAPAALEGTSIAAGESIVVTVAFDGSTDGTDGFAARSSNVNGVYEGALTLRTNDADSPISTIDLAAFWQPAQEGGNEPNVNEVWQVFGFGNEIANLPFAGGGENSILDFDDLYLPAPGQEDIEVLSPYWRIADGVTEARATMIAAFNASGSAGLGIHNPGNKGADNNLVSWSPGSQSQTLFPLAGNGSFATTLFDNGDIPDGWQGNEVFGIEMANLSTDPTLNQSGTGTPSQSALDTNYGAGVYTVSGTGGNAVVTDADGNVVEDGYTVRMFQALDADGVAIENVYLGIMDYTGINYDYNDNMFIFEGITPVGAGGALTISGLDDAAADDRLVFTNIDNPNNGGGFGGQEFRNEATFTITNDGIGELDITGFTLGGVDAGDFQVSGTLGTLGVGDSTEVTVTFVGSDPADDGAAELRNATLTVESDGFGGDQAIQLAGLAQLQSESGEEPTVAQIVEALGYSTDVAQGQLNGGGTVETVGDEVLLPYLQRLDGSQPIEVINLAAFLQQGDVSRLNLHDLGTDDLTELFAGDDNQGQTVLPDGLVTGAGDTGSVARATIDRDEPFGLKVTVDGKPTFAAWSDPVANTLDPAFDTVNTAEGHYIRFFEARDAAGAVIAGTYIGVQDYPGGGNFDYNDAMFLVRNVQAYDLTAAEDGDGDGINDALQIDTDNDGTVDFFDGDNSPPSEQAPFGGTAPVLGDTLTVAADTFDTGGQGVAWNDSPGKDGGGGARSDSDVEIIGSDIAFVEAGEWVEYTIDVVEAGTYDFSVIAKAPTDGATVGLSVNNGPTLATITLPDANGPDNDGFGGTDFSGTPAASVQLAAGQQTLRLTFGGTEANNGYVLDLRSFALEKTGTTDPNTPPVTSGITGAPDGEAEEAYSFDVSGFFDDVEDPDLDFDAEGLPAGLSMSASGLISGTPTEDGEFVVTVTATDDDGADVDSTFTLTVAPEATSPEQSPFPGPDAPTFTNGTLTVDASNYDDGGQGIAYNDAPGLEGSSNDGGRTGSDVEQTGLGDIGWIADEEWLEYTVEIPETGTYDLEMLLATNGGAGRTATVDFYQPGSATPYASSGPIANPVTGGWAVFEPRSADGIDLQAGTQIVRVTFNGGSQDFRSFTLTQQPSVDPNEAPVTTGLADAGQEEGTSFVLDAAAAFSDPDGDTLSYSATGLPGDLSIDPVTGQIFGTLPDVAADTDFTVTVTASDGEIPVSTDFVLSVADVPDAPVQTPFPGPDAPTLDQTLTIDATNFDAGGQGVSWNDDPGLQSGAQAARGDTDVELVGAEQDIGYVEAGEWVEYTVNVTQAGTFDLILNAKTPIAGNTIAVSLADGTPLTTFALPDANAAGNTGFGGTTFAQTLAQEISLAAGEQTLRFTFEGSPADNGYLLDMRGFSLDRVEDQTGPEAIGEAGSVTFAQSDGDTWFSVEFEQAIENPAVVMGPLTFNGIQPSTTRIRNVTEDGFEFQLDEWDYLDGGHVEETIGWMAVQQGVHQLQNGQTIAAGVSTASGTETSIDFGTDFGGSAPVVLGQVTSDNEGAAVAERIFAVDGTDFSVVLDREEAATVAHGNEEFSWIALDTGGSVNDGVLAGLTSNAVTNEAFAIDFGGSFATDEFVFLGDMQSLNGGDTSVLRLSSGLTPTGASIFVEEEQSSDTETNHIGEVAGYAAVSIGTLFGDLDIV